MFLHIALSKCGSPERWDALPYTSFDNAKEGKALKIKGKKPKKYKRRNPVEMVTSEVQTTVRFP